MTSGNLTARLSCSGSGPRFADDYENALQGNAMSSNERIRERQFAQVFGSADSDPLQIDVVSEDTAEDFLVYLLIQGTTGPVSTVGFSDRERSFTFAFSSQDLAQQFLISARKQNLLTQVGRILPMTASEYFARKKQGWTQTDLCLDPSVAMLSHPNVQLGINLSISSQTASCQATATSSWQAHLSTSCVHTTRHANRLWASFSLRSRLS